MNLDTAPEDSRVAVCVSQPRTKKMARGPWRILLVFTLLDMGRRTCSTASLRNDYRMIFIENDLFGSERRNIRVRKEFTTMTLKERRRFINAYKFVSTVEPFRRRYEYLVGLHQSLFEKVHVEKQFFPWHRWYLLEFENLLRQADPRVTLPYWDWSLVSQDLWRSGKKDVWTNRPWGLGSNGSSPFNCVENGPFRKHVWRLSRGSGGGCLRRKFMGRMPGIISIHATLRLTAKQFKKFEDLIRSFYHNELHCCIQGTMELPSASNTPEFILHHAFMDKLWYDWQRKGPEYQFELDESMTSRLRGSHYMVGQFMDSSHLVRGIAVHYRDPFPGYQRLHRTLRSLQPRVLNMMDSYNAKTLETCCPKTPKRATEKEKEISKYERDIPLEVALDYGEQDELGTRLNEIIPMI